MAPNPNFFNLCSTLSLSRKPLFHITTDNGVMGLDLKTKSYNSRFHNYHFDSGGLGRYSLGLILVPMIGLGWIFDKTTVSLGLGSSCGFGFGLRGRFNSACLVHATQTMILIQIQKIAGPTVKNHVWYTGFQ